MYNNVIKLNLPNLNISIKPAKTAKPRTAVKAKILTKLTYAVAYKDENGEWFAKVNTKGIEGYKDKVCCEFTEESHELGDKTVVFYKNPDENGKHTKIIRTIVDAKFYPGSPVTYTPFCENQVYSGYLVKKNNCYKFDVSEYIGSFKQYGYLLDCEVSQLKKASKEIINVE